MMRKLIYIGEEFYHKSGTMMSSVYSEDGERYDWGFIQRDLQNGISFQIRPANSVEIDRYKLQLFSRRWRTLF